MSVDFPAPLGPTTATTSPRCSVRSTSCSTVRPVSGIVTDTPRRASDEVPAPPGGLARGRRRSDLVREDRLDRRRRMGDGVDQSDQPDRASGRTRSAA